MRRFLLLQYVKYASQLALKPVSNYLLCMHFPAVILHQLFMGMVKLVFSESWFVIQALCLLLTHLLQNIPHGLKLLLMLYNGRPEETLNHLRFRDYMKFTATGRSRLKLERIHN